MAKDETSVNTAMPTALPPALLAAIRATTLPPSSPPMSIAWLTRLPGPEATVLTTMPPARL